MGEVCTDELRLEFYEFLAPPVLRRFSLHHMEIDPFREQTDTGAERDLTAGENAQIHYTADGAEADFGGIYSFHRLVFRGEGIDRYRLEAFDGSKYYTVAEGVCTDAEQSIRLEKPVEGSYRIRLITGRPGDESLGLHIFGAE